MKINLFYIWLFYIGIFLCGCKERVFPNTSCYIYGVRDNPYLGTRVCQEEGIYYYYSNGAIYQYQNKESTLLIDNLQDKVVDIACNNGKLYYKVYAENVLHVYDIQVGKTEQIEWEGEWQAFLLLEQEIFVFAREGENSALYVIKDDKKKLLSNLVKEEDEGRTLEIIYEEYVFSLLFENNAWKLRNIRMTEDRQYALPDIWINDTILSIDNETYIYDGKEYDMGDVIEKEEAGSATAPSQTNIFEGKVYMLYQYGLRAAGGNINPVATDKRYNDSIYGLDPETGEVTLVYKTADPTIQIADFSIEHDTLYLLKNDGLYRCNMRGEEEEFILENTYESMSFEDCNGKLFVYDGDSTFDSSLITVVE